MYSYAELHLFIIIFAVLFLLGSIFMFWFFAKDSRTYGIVMSIAILIGGIALISAIWYHPQFLAEFINWLLQLGYSG